MPGRDFITEAILSIEDFNNVDSKLMEEINANEEYRRIFEEYKEISELACECVPEPSRNGVTLHDAVMTRVRKGDTAPRYVGTSGKFRFPIATAASLAIILVVAAVATITTKTQGNMESMNFSAKDTAFEETDHATSPIINNAEFLPAPKAVTEIVTEQAATAELKSASGDAASVTADDTAAANDRNGSVMKKAEEYKNTVMGYYADEEAEAETESVEEAPVYSKVARNDQIDEIQLHGSEEYSDDTVFSESTVEYDIDSEITLRLESANKYPIPEENKITLEDIEAYGKGNFIAWFDSIQKEPNFTELYSKKQFIRFCTELWKTE